MQIPVKISFHNLDASEALMQRIREKIGKLEERVSNLVGLSVMVEAAHHHQTKGRLYSVRIIATLPGGGLAVSHHPGKNPLKHDKVFAAMNSAFIAIEKRIMRFLDQRPSRMKPHASHWEEGVVSNLLDQDGYGFLSTQQGAEIYFHRNAVQSNRFDDLDIGSKVRFVANLDEGIKGPQASAVRLPSRKKAMAA